MTEIKLNQLTVTDLKALGYDLLKQQKHLAEQLATVEQELATRQAIAQEAPPKKPAKNNSVV